MPGAGPRGGRSAGAVSLRLYDIFWSHFCEKARWCLDYKRLPHAIVRVNPFTRAEARALGVRGDVPVLQDGPTVVEGSAAIAAYLEERWPDPPLLPGTGPERAEILALQKRCDDELGPDARRVAYEVALGHTGLLKGTLLWTRAPKRWLNPLILRLLEPRLRRKFNIFPNEVGRSRERLHALLPELQTRVARGGFLVGRDFTLADLAAAALLDPLEIVSEFVRDPRYAAIFEWKRGLMRAHRRRQRAPWSAGPPPCGYPT
jgi:glutathione S-transferase